MLYSFVKILMTVALRFFYRHIHISGLENIPAKGPAIIISNHPSSLMDAALIGILLKRPIHYFARGDVFINKPVSELLSWLHMMPVHNHEGGRRTIHANSDSFSQGQKILSNGGIIVFFPESTSHIERQLLYFRKGVFRLGFKTAVAHDFAFEIPIVPVGITYDHPSEGQNDVQVHAGKPLLLTTYKNKYQENPSATLLQISKDAYEAVRAQVLHIEITGRLDMAERLIEMNRFKHRRPSFAWKVGNRISIESEQSLCKEINQWGDSEFEKTRTMIGSYYQQLKKQGLKDQSLSAGFHFPLWKSI
jgi:glycerol-3-phosphate O-acyltransferase / dihydroxyacetone phosphate acyltransferase